MLNVIYDPFFTRKTLIAENNSLMTPFFTLFVLSRTSDNTTSQNIGGTDAWAVPHLKFLGDHPPVTPRSPSMIGRRSISLSLRGIENVFSLQTDSLIATSAEKHIIIELIPTAIYPVVSNILSVCT